LRNFIKKKIFNMGKLKEHYLNNLTPEEMEERYGVSAFEYVELMENYKHLFDDSGNPIPDDVIEQMIKERESAEADYYEQSAIDEINDSMKLKYTERYFICVRWYSRTSIDRYNIEQIKGCLEYQKWYFLGYFPFILGVILVLWVRIFKGY